MEKNRQYIFEWLVGAVPALLAVIAWLQVRDVGSVLTVYAIFPLLGLIAFGLMWSHYINGAIARYRGVKQSLVQTMYMRLSMGIVLALLVLHPALLAYGLWRDGMGLPPTSYLNAYTGQLIMIILGMIALTIFIAFEFKRKFGERSWWRYVDYAQIFAMIAILVHALQLGRELTLGWYAAIWWLYGASLVASFGYSWWYDSKYKTGGGNEE